MQVSTNELLQNRVMLTQIQTAGMSSGDKVSKELIQLKEHLESFPHLLEAAPDFCGEIANLDEIFRQAKQFVLNISIYPYGTSGWHILSVSSFDSFRKGISEIKALYDSCLRKIASEYEKIYELAQKDYYTQEIKHEFPEPDYFKAQLELKIMMSSISEVKLDEEDKSVSITDEELQELEKVKQAVVEKTDTLLKASHDKMIKNITECISELASLVRTSKSKEVRKSAAGCLLNALKQVVIKDDNGYEFPSEIINPKLVELAQTPVASKDNILNDKELNEFMEIIQTVLDYIAGENHGREVDS